MKARYNKGLDHCIEIYNSKGAMCLKKADAKVLAESINKAIAEAERDFGREQLTPFEDALDDIIHEAISINYIDQYWGDRMVKIGQWEKRLKKLIKED